MNDYVYTQFADSFLAMIPDFPMESAEIELIVRTKGLGSFLLIADDYIGGIAETAELLIRLSGGERE